MAEETLTLRFTGPAVDDHSMDAYDFAQALMGFSKAVQIAAHEVELTGPSAPVVKITDVKPGSFIAELALVADLGLFEHAKTFLNSDTVNAALNLEDLINVVFTTFVALKALQGRKIKKTEPVPDNPGQSQLTLSDNANITVQSGAVVNLIQNPIYINAADQATAPLAREGVTGIQYFDSSTPASTPAFELQKEDYVPFKESLPEKKAEQLEDKTEITYLQFVRPVLNNSTRKWGADTGDGIIDVKISDENFLKLVEMGRISFSGRPDLYKVRLRTTQEIRNSKLTKRYEVIEVLSRQDPNGGQRELMTF